ncbi:MAG TPA: hypothetical protein PKE64_16330 [Anaerolineae bacterium]|nr:hypothetical protein [Anaerolineae bacterium]
MGQNLLSFLVTRQINSIQKLNFLLFLYRNPYRTGTIRDFALWLYWGNELVLEGIINELRKVNLIISEGEQYGLSPAPEIRHELENLAQTFDDPLARQILIDRLRQR